MPERRIRWNTVLGGAVVAATLVFLALAIARQWGQLAQYDWEISPIPLLASVVALVAAFVWGGWVWRYLLRRLGVRVAVLPLTRLWFLSSLARYVPGKVWQFIGAAQLGSRMGLEPVPLVTSMLLQMGFVMVAGAAVAIPGLLLAGFPSAPLLAGVLSVVSAGAIVAVHPSFLNRALGLAGRVVPGHLLRWEGDWGDGIALLAMHTVSWVAQGVAFVIFVYALVDLPPGAVPLLIGANALAMVAGMLVFPVPAGLGAREAVLALLLAPYAPLGAAALLAVASRLWIIAAELVGAVFLVGLGMAPDRSGA